ncbi:hypothetical protein AVEN_252969-1 [Araneus ventricosus]|uniref:Uncharacterized protein n=1 Tax=Araneus ventricosus TaxID=182803 RepID=A0A4Y2T3A0_ARAVE|nr:hypothetical protein AVEN_252969-1 [Araneus ventricosus]
MASGFRGHGVFYQIWVQYVHSASAFSCRNDISLRGRRGGVYQTRSPCPFNRNSVAVLASGKETWGDVHQLWGPMSIPADSVAVLASRKGDMGDVLSFWSPCVHSTNSSCQ